MKHFVYLLMCCCIVYFHSCRQNNNPAGESEAHGHVHSCDHEHDHNHSDVSHNHMEHGHNHENELSHDHDCGGHNHEVSVSIHEDDNNSVIFTTEQASNILDFQVETIRPQQFYHILKTSGQILSAPGDDAIVAATISGIVRISASELIEGNSVKQGQPLFSISGSNLTENNHSLRIKEARIVMETAKSGFDRAELLIKDKIITQNDYLTAKSEYEQALLNYRNLTEGISSAGKTISSPMNGYLKNLMVQSGQYVETGQAMATVTQNKKLILRADVSQRYLPAIRSIRTASFSTPYDNTTYDLEDIGGKLISYGRNTDGNTFYTPVTFEFDNIGDIIEGSFVEVYLKSQVIPDALVLPKTALIEEQGHFFVFVQQNGHEDEYIKTEVSLGSSDGTNYHILAGLASGQKVVIKGAFAVKLASLSGTMPEHSHDH